MESRDRGEVDHGGKTPSRLVVSCRDPAQLLEIAKQVFDEVTPTTYGEIAWDAGLAIRIGRPVRVIGRGNHPPQGETGASRWKQESTIARAVTMTALAPYAPRSRQGVNLSGAQSGEHPI